MDRASAHGSALCQSGGTPLNQGNNGTCSAYAFGCVTSVNLMNKYDVAISAEKIKDDALEGAQTMKGENVRNGSTMSELGVPFATSWSMSRWIACRLDSSPASSSGAASETGIVTRSIHDGMRIPPLQLTGCLGALGKE